jgi:hypothetical protein
VAYRGMGGLEKDGSLIQYCRGWVAYRGMVG